MCGRAGGRSRGTIRLTRQVSNTRVGIIGLGRIGSAIAKRLSAFGCAISYHNRRPVEGSPYTYVGSRVELARGVDVLIVAAAGGSGTQGLVSGEVIEALGADGYLVNIARGSVVDEDALVDALVGGRLAGAGLDVFEDEPNVPEALLTMDNVVRAAARCKRHSGNARGDGGTDAAQPGQLPEVWATGHAGADAGRRVGLDI